MNLHESNSSSTSRQISSNVSEFDNALKEAIRRSLEDVEPKTCEAKPAPKPKPSVSVTSNESKDLKKAPIGEEVAEEKPATLTGSGLQALSAVPVVSAEVKSTSSTMSDQGKAEMKVEEDDDFLETASATDSETSVPEVELADKTEESFASDAIGSGDIAEAMGATFDIVAGVISEMLSEADSHSKKSTGSIVSAITMDHEAPLEQEKSKDAEKEVEESMAETADNLILDSVKSTHASSDSVEKEENDWEVVLEHDNECLDEVPNTKADEEIARAASMLGSALFNSDMKSSAEMISTLSAAEESYSNSFSSATSVPSTVSSMSTGSHVSHVALVQRIRWASHLEKLRELGFNNESMCVEILERLEAANIGVDSEDDVSVTQVVNAILEQN